MNKNVINAVVVLLNTVVGKLNLVVGGNIVLHETLLVTAKKSCDTKSIGKNIRFSPNISETYFMSHRLYRHPCPSLLEFRHMTILTGNFEIFRKLDTFCDRKYLPNSSDNVGGKT